MKSCAAFLVTTALLGTLALAQTAEAKTVLPNAGKSPPVVTIHATSGSSKPDEADKKSPDSSGDKPKDSHGTSPSSGAKTSDSDDKGKGSTGGSGGKDDRHSSGSSHDSHSGDSGDGHSGDSHSGGKDDDHSSTHEDCKGEGHSADMWDDKYFSITKTSFTKTHLCEDDEHDHDHPPTVPLPASGTVLLTGIGLLAALRRKLRWA